MRSAICPFLPDEAPMARHERRLKTAVDYEAIVRAWLFERGGTLRINNGTHHWQIRIGGMLIEWWPSSGKCVKDQRWNKSAKLHDYHQLLRKIEKWLAMKGCEA